MKQQSAGAVIRKALSPSTGLVVLVLVAVMLYYVATHLREILPKLPRPALEAVARAVGIPKDIIERSSNAILAELIYGAIRDKAAKAAVWATLIAVLATMWKLRGLWRVLMYSGGVSSVAAGAAIIALILGGMYAVTAVGRGTGLVDDDGGGWTWGGGGGGGGGGSGGGGGGAGPDGGDWSGCYFGADGMLYCR